MNAIYASSRASAILAWRKKKELSHDERLFFREFFSEEYSDDGWEGTYTPRMVKVDYEEDGYFSLSSKNHQMEHLVIRRPRRQYNDLRIRK